jgi:hypothetical protein
MAIDKVLVLNATGKVGLELQIDTYKFRSKTSRPESI